MAPIMCPTLNTVYKGRYLFRLGTTSFIYPDSYAANVRLLGPHLDEIELLFFESGPADSLPSGRDIHELAGLAVDLDVSYNVHLPIDISPGSSDPAARDRSVSAVTRILALTAPLDPTTCTLHLPYTSESDADDDIHRWRDHICESLGRILDTGIDPRIISVETLDYPIGRIADIIEDINLSVCLDTGHMMICEFDLDEICRRFKNRISIVHLHGVEAGKDHLSLDRLSEDEMAAVIPIIKDFTGSVSMEVFSFAHLKASLAVLEKNLVPYYL
jgi:sugar phosphate isomerase/epimerase